MLNLNTQTSPRMDLEGFPVKQNNLSAFGLKLSLMGKIMRLTKGKLQTMNMMKPAHFVLGTVHTKTGENILGSCSSREF